jgi:hypothetical protein
MFSNCPRHALSTISCIANDKTPEKPLTEQRMKEIAESTANLPPKSIKSCASLGLNLLLVREFSTENLQAAYLRGATTRSNRN